MAQPNKILRIRQEVDLHTGMMQQHIDMNPGGKWSQQGQAPPQHQSLAIPLAPDQARPAAQIVDVPVVVPSWIARFAHNTINIKVDLANPPTFMQLHDMILAGVSNGSGPFPQLYCLNRKREYHLAIQEYTKTVLSTGSIYFVWDFAPEIRFDGESFTLPRVGITDACWLNQEDLADHLRLVASRKISHIFVASVIKPRPVGASPGPLEDIEVMRHVGEPGPGEPPSMGLHR